MQENLPLAEEHFLRALRRFDKVKYTPSASLLLLLLLRVA